jgi:hypothetical protein
MFWALVDRWGLSDDEALELVSYDGKLPNSSKRPRFRLSEKQQRIVAALLEVENAMQLTTRPLSWLRKRTKAEPQSPLDRMRSGEIPDVLRSLNTAALKASLKKSSTK